MAKQIENVTCTACGCLCDDLIVRIADCEITTVDNACSLGEPLFVNRHEKESCSATIEGEQVSFEAAIERASDILADSSAPLIWGMAASIIEAQRSAIELADRLGATLDPALSPFHRAALVALQSVGVSTCTLGEVKQRADVILFWGCDPVTTHPRLIERFLDPPGRCIGKKRKVFAVSAERNATADIADEFLQVQPGSDFEVLTVLRAIEQGVAIEGNSFGGISFKQLLELAAQLQTASYSILFFGPDLAKHGNAATTLESLFLLVRHLNGTSRCGAIGLGGPIAENALTWQTGYPCGVNFAAGYPRYDAYGFSANRLLELEEVDAVLMLGNSGLQHLSESAQNRLGELPVVLLDTVRQITSGNANLSPIVSIPVAQPGLHTGGTVFRMDGIPLPLRPSLKSNPPSEADVINTISKSVIAKCS